VAACNKRSAHGRPDFPLLKDNAFSSTAPGHSADKRFTSSLSRRIEGLDELRGISVLMVMVFHLFYAWGVDVPLMGPWAVDIFFVISGYLIGTILLQTREQADYFRTFYVRRIFRIWPLMFAVVCFGVVLAIAGHITFLNALPYYATFTQNFIPVSFPLVPRNSPEFLYHLPGCIPMWSLAIEEQFYLLAPFFVRFLKRSWLPVFFIGIAATSITFRCFHPANDFWYANIWLSWCRVHHIAFGFLLACKVDRKWLGALFAYWAVLVATRGLDKGVLELPLALLTLWAVGRSIAGRAVVANGVLAELGKRCFGLYLLHWPIYKLIVGFDRGTSVWITALIMGSAFAITIVVAVASFRFFEMPIQRQRVRFE